LKLPFPGELGPVRAEVLRLGDGPATGLGTVCAGIGQASPAA